MVQQKQTLDPEQHAEPDPVHEVEEVNVSSASEKKLKLDDSTSTSEVNDCNVIVNIEVLKNGFEKLCRLWKHHKNKSYEKEKGTGSYAGYSMSFV